MYRNEPICIKCLHKHPTALTCQQAKEAQAAAARPQRVKVCEGYCVACEADHSGFTCHDFQTMKAKALREQAARESHGDARITHLHPISRANPCKHCGSMIPSAHHICNGSAQAAEPQDGSKVAGYRKLSDAEIAQMNAFKAAGRNLVDEIDTLIQQLRDKTTGAAMRSAAQAAEDQTAMRWLHVARTHTQQAVMAACRAVARPADDC